MKTIRTLLLSGVVLAATAQAAQNFNIDFPFRTPAGDMPAGRYSVAYRDVGSASHVQMRNVATGASLFIVPTNPTTNVRGTEKPRMVFACGTSGCDLKQVWRNNSDGLEFKQRKLSPAEQERLALVHVDATKSE